MLESSKSEGIKININMIAQMNVKPDQIRIQFKSRYIVSETNCSAICQS